MAESRNRKNHKQALQNFKDKKMSEQKQPVNQQKLPDVREVPTWDSNAQFTITGLEFEYLYNYITSVAQAYAAAQSVMNRALLAGQINMEFDKLVTNPDGTQSYERMSPEEAAPNKADFAKLLEAVKNPPTVPQSPISETPSESNGLRAV